MSEIKIINTNIIGRNPNANKLTEVFDNKYYYEYRHLDGQQIIVPELPYTGNLYAWYDSDTLGEDYKKDGQVVDLWRDTSGNNRSMIQTVENSMPIFTNTAQHKPCLLFTTNQHFLVCENKFTELFGSAPKTIFAVYTSNSYLTDAQAVCGINGTQSNSTWFEIYTYSNSDFSFIGYSADLHIGSYRYKTFNLKVGAISYDSTRPQRLECYMNKIRQGPINPTLNTGDYFFYIGRSTTSGTNPLALREHFLGYISEVIVYSEGLNEQQIFDITDYLMIKHNIVPE